MQSPPVKPCPVCKGTGCTTGKGHILNPAPCGACDGAGTIAVEPGEVLTGPTLQTISDQLLVTYPAGEGAPPQIGPDGGVSIGPGHLPGVGPVLHLAVHHTDGTTLALTLGAAAFNQFGRLFNDAARQIMTGQFDRPPVVN